MTQSMEERRAAAALDALYPPHPSRRAVKSYGELAAEHAIWRAYGQSPSLAEAFEDALRMIETTGIELDHEADPADAQPASSTLPARPSASPRWFRVAAIAASWALITGSYRAYDEPDG